VARLATRRLRLNGDFSALAAARAIVTEVLIETDLRDLHDDAVLLTTELTSNAVRHARTAVDLCVEGDGEMLRVTVGDGVPGHLPPVDVDTMRRRAYAMNGRGLALVDRLATSWGTTHTKTGKLVWFELCRGSASEPSETDHGATVHMRPSEPESESKVAQAMERLVATGDFVAARVALDRRDGTGSRPIASYGTADPLLHEIRVPVPVAPPWIADLTVSTSARELSPRGHAMTEIVAQSVGLALDNERLRRDDLQRRASLRYAAVASELLAQSLDIELTSALIPRLVVPRLGQWCAVLRYDEDGVLQISAATHAEESRTPFVTMALSQPANRQAVSDAITRNSDTTLASSIDGVAIPLVVRERSLGALAVGRPAEHRHTIDEMLALDDLARRAALALDNAALHAERSRIARTLQQSLLPPSLPDVKGMRFGAEYIPALGGADVGGDFYDVVARDSGEHVMVIGDVSGKGVAAAAVTGLIRDVFRVLIRDDRPCLEVLARLNETVKERGAGRFATLAIAEVSHDGSDLCARLYLAGHDHPLAARADGRIETVGNRGTAIGLLDQIQISPMDVRLAPGDTLVFYTDGVTERRRGDELFGSDRVRAALDGLGGHDASVIAARLRAATIAFSAEPPRDDIAILTVHNDATG
jgi:phosphoserine phosphatase RsbU/P